MYYIVVIYDSIYPIYNIYIYIYKYIIYIYNIYIVYIIHTLCSFIQHLLGIQCTSVRRGSEFLKAV